MPILRVEIANTPLHHMQGLMGRKHLPKNSGMLFDFGKPKLHAFWMANTYIPLQIAFVDDSGRVGQISRMTPLSTRPVKSNAEYRYALEVNDGWFDANDIKVGSTLQLPGKGIYHAKHDIMNGLSVEAAGIKDWWKGIKNIFKKKEEPQPQTPPAGTPPSATPAEPPQDPSNTPAEPPQPAPAPPQPGQMPGVQPPQPSTPKTQIEQSYREILKAVLDTGTKVVLEYITKDGFGIPHKTIVPPMELLPDANKHPHNLIRFFSETDGDWRSFLIEGPNGNGIQGIYDVMGQPIVNAEQIYEMSWKTPPTQEDDFLAKGIMTPDAEERKQLEYQRLLTHKT